jgi:hypothetical protein
MLFRIRFDGGSYVDLPVGTSWLGRSERCAIRLTHRSVSREHLLLHVAAEELAVEDLDSSNGTWLDRTRLRGRKVVRDAVELRVGEVSLILTPVADAGRGRGHAARCPACERELAEAYCRNCVITRPMPPPSQVRRALADGPTPLARQVELAQRALTAGRFEDAEQTLAQLADAPTLLERGTPVLWNALLRCAVSLAVATDDARWLQWVFERLAETPDPPLDVLQSVQRLPGSLLVHALPSLDRLLASWHARGDTLPRPIRDSVRPLAGLARALAPTSARPD